MFILGRDRMNTQVLIVAAVAAIAVALLAWWFMQSRRRAHLRSRFGPEYERAIRETGNVAKAETMLSDRERRIAKLHVRSLTAEESSRFSASWRAVQTRFVDDPKGALVDADALITEVMTTRGYPMTDWEQRVADISVDYPLVVDHYRTAHEIAVRHQRGEASTEDMRRAMIAYRELFAELVESPRDTLRRAG
jgi:hypothetical protein